jgi:hypothetical protein
VRVRVRVRGQDALATINHDTIYKCVGARLNPGFFRAIALAYSA